MSGVVQILFVLGLGAFWGASPALNKMLGIAGVPVVLILVAAGFGVGLGLMALQRLTGGRLRIGRAEAVYGLGCGLLLNIPWALSLTAIRHVPVTLSAVIVSTSPLWTYALSLVLRREVFNPLRMLALITGLASSLAIILTRPGATTGALDGWILASLSLPILYAFYNVFTSVAWPKNMPPLTAGIVESFASSLLAVPFALWLLAPSGENLGANSAGYLLLLGTIGMWVLERVCFFSMIRRLGPVSTVQAVYVSTPASVVFGLALFGETADAWLWLSLGLLMLALWLNNRALKSRTVPAPNPATA